MVLVSVLIAPALMAVATAAERRLGSSAAGWIAAPLAAFVQEPAIVTRLQELGAVAAKINTPQEFDAWIRKDYEKWRRVVRETGIRIGK